MDNNSRGGLGRNVYVSGAVSFFMDVSSEMVYPLVPLFLAGVLGVNKSVIGVIEGIAESTASVLRIFSGWLSDRLGNRKTLMGAGYAISTLSRPIIALAGSWHQVLAARFVDRLGKGVRTAPRDAIIAESAGPGVMGKAFGLHRAMDTLGAVAGPAAAFVLLSVFKDGFRTVFWLSMIPAAAAVTLIVLFIRERRPAMKSGKPEVQRPRLTLRYFDWRFKGFIAIAAVFALGNSSDVFLILRSQQLGVATAVIPLMYMCFNVVYSLASLPAGIAADRFGMKRVILAGFVLFALIYLGFATAGSARAAWLLFGLYGVFMGLTEGVQKAFVASIISPEYKATAFGVYNAVVGLAMLPASLLGGWLWDAVSPEATFYYGAATAALSSAMFGAFIIASQNAGKAVDG
jgi:MFS family permease